MGFYIAPFYLDHSAFEKHPCHTKLCAFRCLISENYFFLENYVTSEGAVSHKVLYYQPLPITCYQVRFNANNYFE